VKVKLLLDEDIHFSLAIALRKRGFDVLHVQELERKGMSDREQLNFAVVNERCLFSFNVKDFVILHNTMNVLKTIRNISALLYQSSYRSVKR
jgi:predicted nuclease of predicted toxin-antitoxin system